MGQMNDTTLTVAEAAACLGLSTRHVAKLAARGTLTVARVVGRAFLLDVASIKAYRAAPVGRPRDPEAPHSRYKKTTNRRHRRTIR